MASCIVSGVAGAIIRIKDQMNLVSWCEEHHVWHLYDSEDGGVDHSSMWVQDPPKTEDLGRV